MLVKVQARDCQGECEEGTEICQGLFKTGELKDVTCSSAVNRNNEEQSVGVHSVPKFLNMIQISRALTCQALMTFTSYVVPEGFFNKILFEWIRKPDEK